jgi:hypothetical protein
MSAFVWIASLPLAMTEGELDARAGDSHYGQSAQWWGCEALRVSPSLDGFVAALPRHDEGRDALHRLAASSKRSLGR